MNQSQFGGSILGNFFEVVTIFSPFPRVATALQPWAVIGNGVAVQDERMRYLRTHAIFARIVTVAIIVRIMGIATFATIAGIAIFVAIAGIETATPFFNEVRGCDNVATTGYQTKNRLQRHNLNGVALLVYSDFFG
jgi:hypothetical protein